LKYYILISTIIYSFTSLAQPGNVGGNQKIGILSGTVFDSISRKPMEYVSVKLFSVKDSSVKAGIYTDIKGNIKLDEIPLGMYYVKVSMTGYQTKTIKNVVFTMEKPNRDLGNISLTNDTVQRLDEVKSTSQKENFYSIILTKRCMMLVLIFLLKVAQQMIFLTMCRQLRWIRMEKFHFVVMQM
jgi:hypothetical protein